MLHESEYLAPLDPDLLAKLEQKINYVQYHESADIWAFGITLLCYIFNEDFNLFYDWGKKIVNEHKVMYHIDILKKSNYDQKVIKLLSRMLDFSEYQRISLEELYAQL